MKKSVSTSLFLLTALGILAFSGCDFLLPQMYKPLENDLFIYRIDGRDEITIAGFTELGQEQKYIVLPTQIDDLNVVGIGPTLGCTWGAKLPQQWDSPNLEKLYVPKDYNMAPKQVFAGCPNLKKCIFITGETFSLEYYKDESDNFFILGYIPRYIQESYRYCRSANISFLWNYADAENSGYYWIDDIDYGTTISYIPEDPVRDGYRFTGWYKEPECINPWDFSTDTAPAVQYDECGNVVYQETCLYAGWTL